MTEILDDEAADLRRANAELQRRLDSCTAALRRGAGLGYGGAVIGRPPATGD